MKTMILVLSLFIPFVVLGKLEVKFSPKDNLEASVASYLEQAKSSIDMAIYTFSSLKVKKVLARKLEKGVKVRLIIEKGSDKKVQDFFSSLVEAGLSLRYVGKINHHKFVIIDGNQLVNSSANLSGSPRSALYDENLIYCNQCVERVGVYQKEFDQLYRFSNLASSEWKNDAIAPEDWEKKLPIHQNYPGIAFFTGANFTPYYSKGKIRLRSLPIDSKGRGKVDSELVAVITSLEKGDKLKVASGHFRSYPLYKAIKAAAKKGVLIDMLLDGQEYVSKHRQKSQDRKIKKCLKKGKTEAACYRTGALFGGLLSQLPINLKFKSSLIRWYFPYAKQMHHKYMIVEKKGHRSKVYSGSYNWSYNAEFKTFENIGIYTETKVIKAFLENFKTVMNYGGGRKGFLKKMKKVKDAKLKIELVFDPISMTSKEFAALKSAVLKKCRGMYQQEVEKRVCDLK